MSATPKKKYVNDHEIAETYGISERTVARYVKTGLLRAHRIGPKLVRFDADEVKRALIGEER